MGYTTLCNLVTITIFPYFKMLGNWEHLVLYILYKIAK